MFFASLPLFLLPLFVILLSPYVPWLYMWLLALSIFAGFKWLTWQETRKKGGPPNWKRAWAYLFLWPGMDAQTFLQKKDVVPPPSSQEWMKAFLKMSMGFCLFWGIARLVAQGYSLLTGWIGMIGLIFILHFGFFHLLALFWQCKGIQAEHMFRAPAFTPSLADFWGKRWNRGFRHIAHQFIFQPLRPRIGSAGATFIVFLFSGLIHDLVISVPAGGGYGLPTLYFLIQGTGVLWERSPWGKRWRLGQGLRGWCFTFVLTAGPAYWLFHPIFIDKVILPFMKATQALGIHQP